MYTFLTVLKLMVFIFSMLLLVIGAIFGFFGGCYLSFSYLFDGGIDAIQKIIMHGSQSTRNELKEIIIYAFLWSSCGLIIPIFGLIGLCIGMIPGWLGMGLSEAPVGVNNEGCVRTGWLPSRLKTKYIVDKI